VYEVSEMGRVRCANRGLCAAHEGLRAHTGQPEPWVNQLEIGAGLGLAVGGAHTHARTHTVTAESTHAESTMLLNDDS
jgi:hypothetical protein